MRKIFVLLTLSLLLCSCSYAETREQSVISEDIMTHDQELDTAINPVRTSSERRARFIFIGDIMTHDQQLDAARNKHNPESYDFSPQFRRVKPLLEDAFLVGNLETVFAGRSKKLRYAGFPFFNTPDILAELLSKDLHVDLLTLANNHIFDRKTSGARRTVQVLNSQDICWVGLGVDDVASNDAVLLENDGIRAAFINHTYGSNEWPKSKDVHLNVISSADITKSLERAKSLSPDIIIACFHWGNEYHFSPNIHQKRAADVAFDNGVDLIIGTHPHVLQPVEVRISSDDKKVKAVAWSLGNFVSFQRTLPRERSIILAAEFVKNDEGITRLVKLSEAPLYVIAPGQKRTEVTYAGTDEKIIEKLDFSGLSKSQLNNLRTIGKRVNEFLGAQNETDEYGFYTLWDEKSFDVLPKSKRQSPK